MPNETTRPPVLPTGREKIRISDRAGVSLRTVDNYFRGVPQHENTVGHVERGIRELGWDRLIRLAPEAREVA
jgi:hypothetical protein